MRAACVSAIRFCALIAFVAFDLIGRTIGFARSATERTRSDLEMRAIDFLRRTRVRNRAAIA